MGEKSNVKREQEASSRVNYNVIITQHVVKVEARHK